jgi:Cu2+-exporting ATPase
MLALSVGSLPWLGLNGALGVLWNYPGYRALLLAPMSTLNYLHLCSRHGILIKDGRSLELLRDIDTIVFDKTGTLTQEQPCVKQVISCGSLSEDELLTYAATAEYKQTHPIAKAILLEAQKRQLSLPKIDHTHVELGYGVKVTLAGFSRGTPDQVIRIGSERFMENSGIAIPDAIKAQQSRCHTQGHSLVMVAIDDELGGATSLMPTIRPEAREVVSALREMGKELVIISGDHEAPTRQMAQELGIQQYFANTLPENTAHSKPWGKANLVEQLQQAPKASLPSEGHDKGRSVCFVGDGINDAIALKRANVSISLRGATTAATDTAQIVLMDESLEQLPYLLEIANEFKSHIDTTFIITIVPNMRGYAGAFAPKLELLNQRRL